MQRIRRIVVLFFTVAFFYTSIGHAIVLHYCTNSETACTEEACCMEENTNCCENDIAGGQEDECCTISSTYIINSNAVREPVVSQNKNLVPDSELFIRHFSDPFIIKGQSVKYHTSLKAPPGRDLLSLFTILLI